MYRNKCWAINTMYTMKNLSLQHFYKLSPLTSFNSIIQRAFLNAPKQFLNSWMHLVFTHQSYVFLLTPTLSASLDLNKAWWITYQFYLLFFSCSILTTLPPYQNCLLLLDFLHCANWQMSFAYLPQWLLKANLSSFPCSQTFHEGCFQYL